MTLSKQDRQTIARARELLAEVEGSSERVYPQLVAKFTLITGGLLDIIDKPAVDDDTEFAAGSLMRLMQDGYSITSQLRMDTHRYEVTLAGPGGVTARGDSEDYFEALSLAMINAGR